MANFSRVGREWRREKKSQRIGITIYVNIRCFRAKSNGFLPLSHFFIRIIYSYDWNKESDGIEEKKNEENFQERLAWIILFHAKTFKLFFFR